MKSSPALRIGLAMTVCIGSRFVAVKNDVKVRYECIYATCSVLRYSLPYSSSLSSGEYIVWQLHTWDTAQDNLGVAVRKRPTTVKKKVNVDAENQQ